MYRRIFTLAFLIATFQTHDAQAEKPETDPMLEGAPESFRIAVEQGVARRANDPLADWSISHLDIFGYEENQGTLVERAARKRLALADLKIWVSSSGKQKTGVSCYQPFIPTSMPFRSSVETLQRTSAYFGILDHSLQQFMLDVEVMATLEEALDIHEVYRSAPHSKSVIYKGESDEAASYRRRQALWAHASEYQREEMRCLETKAAEYKAKGWYVSQMYANAQLLHAYNVLEWNLRVQDEEGIRNSGR